MSENTDFLGTGRRKTAVARVRMSIGSGNITIQGGAEQTVTVIDDNDLKATYEKRSRAVGFVERWFLEDDTNYITSDVTSILKTDNIISSEYNINNELKVNLDNYTISLTSNQSNKK